MKSLPVGYSRSIVKIVKIFDEIEDFESTLAQSVELVRELNQLDALELDAPGHRNWRPFPEV